MSTIATHVPSLPANPLSTFGIELQQSITKQFQPVEKYFCNDDDVREKFNKMAVGMKIANHEIGLSNRIGQAINSNALVDQHNAILNPMLAVIGDDFSSREYLAGNIIEKSRAQILLQHFLTAGKIASQADLQPCNDNEYIGALCAFAQELNPYILDRACEGDVGSIQTCQAVITELNTKMLEFDFRNGPLRRKYDSLKYVLRNIEDVLFELSLQQPISPVPSMDEMHIVGEESSEQVSKKARVEETPAATEGDAAAVPAPQQFLYLNAPEIDEIRARMEAYDLAREQVIKDARDVQKLAKQAVYAVQRGQVGEARKKIHLAGSTAAKIMTTVDKHPSLRPGSFSNCLEEYGEAWVSLEWVTKRRILTLEEMQTPVALNIPEYLGALADFTGEVGRLAVAHASKRELTEVSDIYQAQFVLTDAFTRLTCLSGSAYYKVNKKLDMMRTNLRKVGDLIYELRMLQRTGRTTRTAKATAADNATSNNNAAAGEGGAEEKEN